MAAMQHIEHAVGEHHGLRQGGDTGRRLLARDDLAGERGRHAAVGAGAAGPPPWISVAAISLR